MNTTTTSKKEIHSMIQDLVLMASEVGSGDGNKDWAPLDSCSVTCYSDVPVVLTDSDGTEYWITVQKKRN